MMNKLFLIMCMLSHCHVLLAGLPEELAFHGCEKILHELANYQSHFAQCSTLSSVPVTFCVDCEQEHLHMKKAYDVFAKNCSEQYFDQDRLNIISTMQAILTSLWDKGYCDDCYNKHSQIFTGKYELLNDCFTQHKGNECAACLFQYQDLNNFFISLDQHSNDKVCFDFQDTMNRTRSIWSKEFKCCHREFNRIYFVLASSLICLLPILFYGGTYALTKRRERNHDVMNEDPDVHATPIPTTSSAALLEESNAAREGTVRTKAKSFDNDSDDTLESDDEQPKRL